MADAVVFGDGVLVGARLAGTGAAGVHGGADGWSLWLTAEPADHSLEASRTPMKPSDEGWAAAFVPGAPGAWRVTVEATGLTGQPAPRVEDVIGVIDPGDPGGAAASGSAGYFRAAPLEAGQGWGARGLRPAGRQPIVAWGVTVRPWGW